MRERTLHLVCGLPGAGKTTRSQRIVEHARALHVCADEWVLALGMSLVDYEFRVKLQNAMLAHVERILNLGVSVVVEFGSWSRDDREAIRRAALRQGATTELHYLNAPLDELVRRVRARGGPDAETLASRVLLRESGNFEPPMADEIARFDRYFGPDDAYDPTGPNG